MIDNFLSNLQDGIHYVITIDSLTLLLFFIVLGLPFLYKDWKQIIVLLTVFIIGHCLSLLLVSYNIIKVDGKIITFLMPLMVLMLSFVNIFTVGKKRLFNKIGLLVFISLFFGLLHGISYADQFITAISSNENKLLAVFEIALGILIGLIVVIFLVLFTSFLCQTIFRFSQRDWVLVISAIILGRVIPMIVNSQLLS